MIHRLPDLPRMRAIEERIRASSDQDVVELLATEDGQWLFEECGRVMAADVARRVASMMVSIMTAEAFDDLLGPGAA